MPGNIYMDHASATPPDPRVIAFAMKYLQEDFGNPSSMHSAGMGAAKALEEARVRVAELINAPVAKTIVFTSGATEANNLALRGTAMRNRKKGQRILVSAIEHMSILNPAKDLQKAGYEVVHIPVDDTGLVDPGALRDLVTDDTVVVSVMYANGEIGTIQPIKDIAEVVHEKGAYLHVDGTHAAGKVPLDVQAEGIDLLTISSTDMHGSRGAGALYVGPGVKIQTVLPGGGQERGLRSGTENVFAIAGMGEAARLAMEEMKAEGERLTEVRDALIEGILELDESYLTGHPTQRLPNHASFRFSYIEGESILLMMDGQGVQIATGSACSSQTLEASHTLLALGLKHEEAHGSMVLSLGRSNTMEQVPHVVKAAKETVTKLRAMSPLANKQK